MKVIRSSGLVRNRRTSLFYWVTRLLPTVELTPLRIALAYGAIGFLALYGSDVVLAGYLSQPLLGQVQAVKGGVEVILTAGFVFALTTSRETQLQRSFDYLERQSQELDVLHRVLRHNLRNDLNVIQGRAELIRNRDAPDSIESQCETILDCVDDLTQVTDQAARINRITQNGEGRQAIDLTDIVPQAVDDGLDESADIALSLDLPDAATVEVNPMFEEALAELVTNAVAHNDADVPAVTVDVDPDAGPSHVVEVRIVDNGPGIPEKELQPLDAGMESQLLHLSGLGLWFVKWTVRRSDGALSFEERDGEGTEVRIRVPKSPEMLPTPAALA